MGFGPKVRERRTALGFSQEHLAHEAGISLNAVHKLEMGRISDPHYSTLASIAHALGATVAELAGEEMAVPLGNASETGRPAHVEAVLDEYDEVLIFPTRLTPEFFPSVLEILEQEAHQLENLSIVIEGGYIKAGLRQYE
jgi:transcriptional regulator with XRE-family HTH domain